MLQLPGDVLVPPLCQVGDDDPGVEGARVGPHPQLLDRVLLEVQETYVVILLEKIHYFTKCHHLHRNNPQYDTFMMTFLIKTHVRDGPPDFQPLERCP